jgi:hypothetical protein
MKIIRYSFDGFKPQYQSHHLKHVNYHLYDFNLNEIPKHLQDACLSIHNELLPFYQENLKDFEYGIWCFIDGFKDSQSLNHLTKVTPCWRAEISDDTIVYDVNWKKKLKITDKACELFGFYLPQNKLHDIYNISKI